MLHPSKARITGALKRLGRPSGAFDARRYFRGAAGLAFYNVGTKAVRALAKEIVRANCDRWSVDDAMALADSLMRDRHLETKSVGIEIVARYRRSFTPRLLPAWKRWLTGNLSANWATTDAICGYLIGPLIVEHPALQERLRGWSRDRNMWVRRASVVALIPPARTGAALDVLFDNALTLHADGEDLIQKAVGWALREAGKTDPSRLERHLREHGSAIPRTTVRYAIERFPAPKRRALLKETRNGR